LATLRARQLPIVCISLVWLATAVILWGSGLFNVRHTVREVVFDKVVPLLAPRPPQSSVVVVDIDSDSLARHGPWPWRRDVLANLLRKIALSKPRVIGLDILLSEPDRLSPAALTRNFGEGADREEIAKLVSKLPNGDAAIAAALTNTPSVLGFVLNPTTDTQPPPSVPILARGHIEVPDIWQAAGAIGPLPMIAAAGRGFGAMVLAGDADTEVRRVPLLVAIGGRLWPGLAVETLRVADEASSFILDAAPPRLHVGPSLVPLDEDASLRILSQPAASWKARTIPAWTILDDEASQARLTDRIVLVGSGAPEVGDLRPTPVSATTPSVQIQADALTTIMGTFLPHRPPWVAETEIFGATGLGVIAITIALFGRPVAATVLTAFSGLLWLAGAVSALMWGQVLIDMAGPPAIIVSVFAVTALGSYAQNERLARALRRRFEQRLAPAVVKRLADAPDILRLSGESREVTAVFTDIEGFTALVERSDPREVLQLLDGYLAIVTNTVVAFGGMIDKLMGDGMFVLFNAPIDLPGHVRHAVAAAKAIVVATEAYRRTPLAAKLGLGRTRIGIEAGTAIVGDVGGGSMLDYTALGNVVNTASRLEDINKTFDSSICIGPMAASMLKADEIERLGAIAVRGYRAEIEVFTVRQQQSTREPLLPLSPNQQLTKS
jgi:adenylate cyclase